jgi:PPM family protein phosphatase
LIGFLRKKSPPESDIADDGIGFASERGALGMGTTLVGAFLTPSALLTFNVGDSRCYLFSAGRLIQLSHDDTTDEEKTRSGHRKSHAITQALGGSSFPIAVDPHINVDAPLGPEETLLLCSDGLTDMVDDHGIALALSAANDPIRAVRDLAGKAFAAGARDNASLIVARRLNTPGNRHETPIAIL